MSGKFISRSQVDSNSVNIVDAVKTVADDLASTGTMIDTAPVYASDVLENEAFMRDMIEVILIEPSNENDPSFVEINVNGDYKLAIRDGQPVMMRRYHVAVLAQAKQSRVRQRKVVNPDGSMAFIEENVLSLTYPFSVLDDPNPKKGRPWIKGLLAVPA